MVATEHLRYSSFHDHFPARGLKQFPGTLAQQVFYVLWTNVQYFKEGKLIIRFREWQKLQILAVNDYWA
jgi:hypothetical protein